jgi:hypothetical protein
MRWMVYRVDFLDPRAFALVAALVLTAALVACLVPRGAASVDPMVALREE